MPAKARHRRTPDAEPPKETEDKYQRVRSLLTVCMQLLGSVGEEAAHPEQADATPDLKDYNERELEFLRLARHPDTWPYTYIAVRMKLKLPTLHYLRRKLFTKLGVNSRTALALKVRDWALDQ